MADPLIIIDERNLVNLDLKVARSAKSQVDVKELFQRRLGNIIEYSAESRLIIDGHHVVDFVATKLLSIRGKILNNGRPLPGVRVSDLSLGMTETNQEGEFCFADISEGTNFRIVFSKNGYVFSPVDLVGTLNDEDLSIELSAKRLLTITGTVTYQGVGLPDVHVDGGRLGATKTDSFGMYRFENGLEGEAYVLKASRAGYAFGAFIHSA